MIKHIYKARKFLVRKRFMLIYFSIRNISYSEQTGKNLLGIKEKLIFNQSER